MLGDKPYLSYAMHSARDMTGIVYSTNPWCQSGNLTHCGHMHHRTWSKLVQIMACCLTAPSHYLNQCWRIITEALWLLLEGNFTGSTVGTPYNTAPYITDSNIAPLGHGSQNSWSKLWIPVVKSASVRVILREKVSPRREFMVAPTSIWEHNGSRGTTPRGLTV